MARNTDQTTSPPSWMPGITSIITTNRLRPAYQSPQILHPLTRSHDQAGHSDAEQDQAVVGAARRRQAGAVQADESGAEAGDHGDDGQSPSKAAEAGSHLFNIGATRPRCESRRSTPSLLCCSSHP
jgi:hypothetical protein